MKWNDLFWNLMRRHQLFRDPVDSTGLEVGSYSGRIVQRSQVPRLRGGSKLITKCSFKIMSKTWPRRWL